MKNRSLGGLFTATAVASALSLTGYAQGTTGTGQTTGGGQDQDRVVTVTGCVMAERDVPGRDENLFQRWGLMQQDYVLTNARPQTGASGQMDHTGQSGTAGQAGQAAAGTGSQARLSTHTMLKLDGKDADQLRQHVNQRVEIRGKIDDGGWFQRASAGGGRDRTDRADTTVGTSGAGTTGTGTAGTGTGTTGAGTTGTDGTAGTGTTTGTGATGTTTGGAGTMGAGAAGDNRLASIDIESIRAMGPCQNQ